MTDRPDDHEALEWQVGVWDRISDVYVREIDQRFAPVVRALIGRAELQPGERILDLGTGTGAVAEQAAEKVSAAGQVLGVDISPEMLTLARKRIAARNFSNVSFREGRGEAIPADTDYFDVILSSLTLMYVINRSAAAREIARVLRPGGRLIATVWGSPDECDIVRFQQAAGRFAGPPPVAGVGPGALADASPLLDQLAEAGVRTHVEPQVLGFDFPDFHSAWTALAGVTTAHLPPEQQQAARRAVQDEMYPDGDGPRRFQNLTQVIVGQAT
jgi:ubiquinone/menaquinone biosynthesis C-methylase UbiE